MVSDFSHFALWLAGLATVAQAYTTPVGESPSGNPIAKPGLNEIVPAGSPYTITWSPTTSDCSSVDLVLLRGPSDNIKPLYAIAENVDNSGTYSWTPSTSLEPDTTHYGIQLICDQSGAYQYTTQFGISNPSYVSSSSSSSSGVTSSSAGVTSTRSVHLASSSSWSSSIASSTSAPLSSSSMTTLASTGFPVPGNSTMPFASGTMSHKSSSSGKPTTRTTVLTHTNTPTTTGGSATSASTTEAAPTGTNGASTARAAVGLMGLAAAAVFAL